MRVTKKVKAEQLRRLSEVYKNDGTMLHFTSPFTLLVAVILSAQCTDKRVNVITNRIFPRLDTPAKMVSLTQSQLETEIHDCGLYKAKAKNLLGMCRMLLSDYHGEVPEDFDELVKLPGVGTENSQCGAECGFRLSGYCGGYPCFPRCQPLKAGSRDYAAGSGKRPPEGYSEKRLVCSPSLAYLAWKKSMSCQKTGL